MTTIDERTVTRAIIERYTDKLLAHLDLDAAICGAGPAGLVASYYLAKSGAKVAVFERKLSVGGGMWGGGMMMNEIVVQEEGKAILDELGLASQPYAEGYYTVDAIHAVTGLCYQATRVGATIFNLVSVEDLVVRRERVCGIVINWSAVELAGLHVDPLTVMARVVVDATGHPLEVVRTLERKMNVQLATPSGQVEGERCLWAEVAESDTLKNTREIFPGLFVAGMSANAAFGSYRMGPVFGGMLLSGKKVADLILAQLQTNASASEDSHGRAE
ncbi:MAG: sulfide-dependent adenosine diphosphate thiazole synthase [Thermoleophilia bacterium]|nr:sulfide-dependent adenosine diphosphate thiazole synthase [Thermoleophilia bacterium]